MQVLVDVLHALGGKVAFGNHLHLELCTLHAVALPYHRAEDAVAAEVGVARDEQVARIDALRDAAVDGIDGIEEAFHLLDGVADEHGLEVVAVLQSVADAGGDGVNVLQDRGILDADDVATGLCLDVVTGKHLRKSGSLLLVSTTDGQVSEAVQGDLLGMTRSAKHGEVILRHVVHLVEVVGADEVLVGHDALDGCHDELVAKADMEALQVSLQVRRRRDEDECLASLDDPVDVALEGDAVHVEVDASEVCGIVSEALEVLDAVVSAKIPPDVVILLEEHLGNRRCPAAATQYCYVS